MLVLVLVSEAALADWCAQPVNGIDSSVEEALQRLSKKPGVRAWLMLDRTTGALLKTNGQIATVRPPKNLPSAESSGVDAAAALATPTVASFSTSDTAAAPGPEEIEDLAARELGGMVWGFLSTAGSLVQEMDTEVGRPSRPRNSGGRGAHERRQRADAT